tara:strand:- start:5534 stop:7405 length:1872 start_codon:yes stop_codon:yes gene_type:complete
MTALISFTIYLFFVFLLAFFANRAGKSKSFLSEYFLGSKSIGLWAFAFTYAATSASGGSFMGFPSLIYTHGWVLAWWIAGYMVVPMIALGLLAKRLNQIGRIAGAITIPELLRRRFESKSVGNVATALVVFFMFFFLMAQFKAGAQIMATLLEGVAGYQSLVIAIESATDGMPWVGAADGDYLLCLIIFAVSVIVYTTFGGFRAVVWTDVMQGIVMGIGVLVMLVLAISQVGGLANATRQLDEMTPPRHVTVVLQSDGPLESEIILARGDWILMKDEEGVVRLKSTELISVGEMESHPVEALQITTPAEIAKVRKLVDPKISLRASLIEEPILYAYGDSKKGVYVHAPGPSKDSPAGFLGVMLALSFFAFWNFSGAGQPSYMVRQMAFRDTLTLRRSMVMVAFYFSLIYFPLVIIFTCARVLLPGMEIHPDRVMPEMAAALTENAGVPWLAGLLVAAPFAAVMSSVDSFLLLVSSGVVRDIYQESINPNASEKQMKRLSYLVTVVVGLLGVIAVLHPPQFLQDLIVFASSGLGACFLMPMIFALYWPRTTSSGMVWGMLSGGAVVLLLYLVGYCINDRFGEYLLLGLHPFIWSVLVSTVFIVTLSLTGREPPAALRERFFGQV